MKTRLGKHEIHRIISDIISYEYSIIKDIILNDGSHEISIKNTDQSIIELRFYAKNISNAYLEYNPNIERIQIPVLSSICETTNNRCFLLMGLEIINDITVLVCWDPKRFVHHKSNRSVYVNRENIMRGYNDGYYSTFDHENKIYVCTKGNFEKVLKEYYNDSKVGNFRW